MTAAVTLVAAGVRLPGVYTHAFWEDEVASARILSEQSLPRVLAHVTRTESTPPLWYTLGWLARQAGVPMRDIRLLSVIAGALLAAVVVDLARRFMPLAYAALAGLLVAVGAEIVGHGSELRSYELFALLAALLAWCLLRELDRPSPRRELSLAAVVAAGGLTHYFFAFTVLAALALLWLDPGTRAARRRATVAILAGCAVAAAWSPAMLQQYHQDRFSWIGPYRIRYVAAVPLRLFTYAYSDTPTGLALSVAALLAVAAGGAVLARRSTAGRVVAVLALVPLLEAGSIWAAGMRIFALRNMIGVAPFVAVCAAGAISALPARRVSLAVAAVTVAAFGFELAAAGTGAVVPYDTIARTLVARGWKSSQPLAVFGDVFRWRSPLEWYLPNQPALEMTKPVNSMCRAVFVLRGDDVRLVRLDRPISAVRSLRGATLLTDAAAPPRCVRRRPQSGRLLAGQSQRFQRKKSSWPIVVATIQPHDHQ